MTGDVIHVGMTEVRMIYWSYFIAVGYSTNMLLGSNGEFPYSGLSILILIPSPSKSLITQIRKKNRRKGTERQLDLK